MAVYTNTFTTNNFISDVASGKSKMHINADTIDFGGGMNRRFLKNGLDR